MSFTVRIPHEHARVEVEIGQSRLETANVPHDAVLLLEGGRIDIVDLRVTARTPPFGGCN